MADEVKSKELHRHQIMALIGVVANTIEFVVAIVFNVLDILDSQKFLNFVNNSPALKYAGKSDSAGVTATGTLQFATLFVIGLFSLILTVFCWISFSQLSKKYAGGWEIYLFVIGVLSAMSGIGAFIGLVMGAGLAQDFTSTVLQALLHLSNGIFFILSFSFWQVDKKRLLSIFTERTS